LAGRRAGLLVLAKYVLFQVPGWLIVGGLAYAAHRWLGLHGALAAGALLAFMLKDAVLFPFVRDAYSVHSRPPADGMLGARAVAEGTLAPEGVVRVGPELWRARLAKGEAPVAAGESVHIVAVEGLTLRVSRRDSRPQT
jgi:membrane protein implicated in regulation of membrane protease activity